MRIGVPVAHYHEGNTAEYVLSALTALGHEAILLSSIDFYEAFKTDSFEKYLCIDSGEPLDLKPLLYSSTDLSKVSFWFIDYRHNKDRASRIPNDFENGQLLSTHGGQVLQAQYEDLIDAQHNGLARVFHIPMAADPKVWSNEFQTLPKQFDLGFAGNIWDAGRAEILNLLISNGIKLGFFGHGSLWKQKAAALLCSSKIGFNVNSWYGSPYAYDINMRFFETLSCGCPLITNEVPSLYRLFPSLPSFIRVYRNPAELLPLVKESLHNEEFLASGAAARKWILENATYEHRMKEWLVTDQL